MFHHLIGRFQEAGLKLEIASAPIIGSVGRGGSDIVQIDIQRKLKQNARSEYFRIWPGQETNRIEVVSIDKDHAQLVLMVHEPVRTFEEQAPWRALSEAQKEDPDNWLGIFLKQNNLRRQDVRVDSKRRVTITRKTSSQKRHFLCGVDERQLFICQLPKAVSTVREAHRILKSTDVLFAEGKASKVIRQGEWFFLEPTVEEKRAIENGLDSKLVNIEKKAPIGPFASGQVRGGRRVRQFGGNPHTADELMVFSGKALEHGFPVRARDLFVRGKVRHVDHATVEFKSWKKVIRNTEPVSQGAAAGIGWVD
jgi:hypothetical protein